MNNGEERVFKRGDVYDLRYKNDYMSTESHRPVVIVSSDKGNESLPFVMVVSCTTKERWGYVNPEVYIGGVKSYVKCNEVSSVPKEQLSIYRCTLTESEMVSVDRGLCGTLSLFDSIKGDGLEEEIRELEEEIDRLRSRNNEKDENNWGVVVERDMYKRMYEKALEMLAEANMGTPEPTVKPTAVPVYEATEVAVAKLPEPEPTVKVDINSCTEEELRNIGFSPTAIHHVIANRPYKKIEDLKAVTGITKITYKLFEGRICCVPVKKIRKVAKVNVNTATVEELVEKVGLNKATAQHIRAYRNKNGPFELLEDLMKVSRFGPKCMAKYGPLLEV